MQRATTEYGVGSGASHLVNGHSEEHHLLEQELAAFTGRERALLFSTGCMANLGTVNALMGLAVVLYGFFTLTGRARPAVREGAALAIKVGFVVFRIIVRLELQRRC